MAFGSEGEAVIKRFTVSTDLSTRTISTGATYLLDSYLQNAYFEKDSDSADLYVIKRPALQQGFTYGGGGAGYGQGMFGYVVNGSQYLFAISGNTLYNVQGGQFYGSSSVSSWNTRTPSPKLLGTGAGTSTVIVFNKKIYVFGGSNFGAASSTVQYTNDGATWTTITSTPQWAQIAVAQGRSLPNIAILNNTLYLMNGTNLSLPATQFNDCWSSTDGAFWTLQIADMGVANGILPRGANATVAFKGTIFILGGQEYTALGVATVVNTVIGSQNGVNWAKLATPQWGARRSPAVVVHNGAMYLMGGYTGSGGVYYQDCWKSTDGTSWTNVYSSGLAATGQFSSIVSYQGKMYAFSSLDNVGFTQNLIYSSVDGVVWTLLYTPPWSGGLSAVLYTPPINVYGVQFPGETLVTIDTANNRTYDAVLDVSWSASYATSSTVSITAQWQQTTLNFGQYLIIKNTNDAWVYSANQLSKIIDPNYPAFTVSGIANLNSRLYVMDTKGIIWGSDINAPLTWNGLNYIQSSYTKDGPVAIAVHKNMVVAFRNNSILFFYDNGQSVGNTLSPYINNTVAVGCVNADSIVAMDATIYFMSQAIGLGRSISRLNGVQPEMVSSPDINRLLDGNPCATVQAMNLKLDGHDFYVLALTDATGALPNGVTLVYDVQFKQWAVWNSASDGIGGSGNLLFRGINRAGALSGGRLQNFVQDRQTKAIYLVTPIAFQDIDQNATITQIPVVSQGSQIDFGTYQNKFAMSIDIVSDKYSTSNFVTITKSDDDLQTSQTLGVVDLSLMRPRITRGGSFRRRIISFSHSSNNPLRLIAYELAILPGTI